MREAIFVRLRERTFVVHFASNGTPRNIKERRKYAAGTPYEALYDAPYWHHSHKRPIRGLAARILDIAIQERQRKHAPEC